MRLLRTICCLFAIYANAAEPGTRRIEREVRHELVMLPFYGIFDDLAFRVDGDKVELLGAVTRPSLKADAERAVKHIEGVEIVENKVEVLPLSPQDDRIRLAAYRVIYGHTALSRYGLQAVPSIHIVVRNGHITLRGAVANVADRNITGIQANTIDGVFSVTNELSVDKAR
jgi:hyperosmotically inducible protein